METRDVFLCHAHADKELFVRPFAAELHKWGVTFWLDEAEIGIGDSITRRVSEGLVRSHYVVVFVTENFLSRNFPHVELQSALNKEASSGELAVIPIVAIPHQLFANRFPLLRDKLYLRWTGDLPQMAEAILRTVGRRFEQSGTRFFPLEYTGPVWLRFLALPQSVGVDHRYVLRWGPWQCEGVFSPGRAAVCFNMTKGPDSFAVPLFIQVMPACQISTGTGAPPCDASTDINYNWQRV